MAYSRDYKINKDNNTLRDTGKSFFIHYNNGTPEINLKNNIGFNYPFNDNRNKPVKLNNNENEKTNRKNLYVEKKDNDNKLNYLNPDTAAMAQNFGDNFNKNNINFFIQKPSDKKDSFLNPDTYLMVQNYKKNNSCDRETINNNKIFPEKIQNQNQRYLNQDSSKVTQKGVDSYIKNENLTRNRYTKSSENIFYNNDKNLNTYSMNDNKYINQGVFGGREKDNCDIVFYNELKKKGMII